MSNRIAEFRKRKGWTQQRLAEEIGCHWVTISKLEREVIELRRSHMVCLSSVLGCRPHELIAEAPAPVAAVPSFHFNDPLDEIEWRTH